MRKMMCLVLMVCSMSLVGCGASQVKKNWASIDGSRASATVDVAYDYLDGFEEPIVNEQEALSIAIERCKIWGYIGAEAFGGVKKQYSQKTGLTVVLVVKTFQCTGRGDSPTPNELKK